MKPWNLKQVANADRETFLKTLAEIRELRKLTPGEEAIFIEFVDKFLS